MEVLSPAGNLEKVKYAVAYGADAVYAGSQAFSLRAKADNFSQDDLVEAVDFCHTHNRKLYVPLNIYAHNRHLEGIKEYLKHLAKSHVDAVIVSDLGVFDLVKSIAPTLPIHISTQANATSYQAVNAWKKLGAKRIILARELTFSEIKEIKNECPDIELEIFVHGAMCISYSGRCLLSAFLNNKSANLGEFTHPCRWQYHLTEESRPEQSFGVEEDEHGFYFMNSKDLCLWNKLEDILSLGLDSVKIEGRMKSLYYISAVTRAYKQSVLELKSNQQKDEFWKEELEKISHRIYTEAFFDEFDATHTQNYETSSYIRDWQFVGNITKFDAGYARVKSYHKITDTDEIEIIFPEKKHDLNLNHKLQLFDENMREIAFTKPNSSFFIKLDEEIPDYGILRKKIC